MPGAVAKQFRKSRNNSLIMLGKRTKPHKNWSCSNQKEYSKAGVPQSLEKAFS